MLTGAWGLSHRGQTNTEQLRSESGFNWGAGLRGGGGIGLARVFFWGFRNGPKVGGYVFFF